MVAGWSYANYFFCTFLHLQPLLCIYCLSNKLLQLKKLSRLFAGGKITVYQPIILYRKFTADKIFNGYELLPDNYVLITTVDGVVEALIDKKDAGDNIEALVGIISPGFVNAHCHTELSYLKDAIPSGTGLVQFVQRVMGNRSLLSEAKIRAMQLAEKEMYNSGIVAVGDICNTADSITIKKESKLWWHNFIEISGFVEAVAAKRLADTQLIFDAFSINNLANTTLSPHAPYSVSKALFSALNTSTAGELITIHNQESAAEDELYLYKTGGFLELYKNFGINISSFMPAAKTSFQTWLPYFTNNQSIISVHNTCTTQGDIDFLMKQAVFAAARFYFCICINANKYIEQKIPPIQLLRKNNCQIIIGTDSYASNWHLNIWEEIKTIQQETAFAIPLPEILQWATINGARALQMDNLLGSFDIGKKPGIVLLEGVQNLKSTPQSSSKRIL